MAGQSVTSGAQLVMVTTTSSVAALAMAARPKRKTIEYFILNLVVWLKCLNESVVEQEFRNEC